MSKQSDAYEVKVSTVIQLMTNFPALWQYGTIKCGRNNRWFGASFQPHQIDVSLEDMHNVLLVDCKYWKKKISLGACLTLLSRVINIALGPHAKGRTIRGALVPAQGFHKGCVRIVDCYSKQISLYTVNPAGELADVVRHRHYIQLGGSTSLLEDLQRVQEDAKKQLEYFKQLP